MTNLERVEAAMGLVDRSLFVPAEFKEVVNLRDEAIPIGPGQTVPNKEITRLMITLADIQPDDVVLEVGFGSGYQATVLSALCCQVHSVEYRKVDHRLVDSLPDNIFVYDDQDACRKVPELVFDAIIVTCAVPGIFALWRTAMKEGSRIVAPVGELRGQTQAVRKYQVIDGKLRDLGDYAYGSFVPVYLSGDYEIFKGVRKRV